MTLQDILNAPFIDPSGMDFGQILWALLSYGYVLFTAANLIGDGSEPLMLIPEIEGIVGPIVLPVLGAVPDAMIVLFSGLGTRCHAQVNVAVGVGALSGSTIMLLCIPWFSAIVAGRVDVDDKGVCQYRPKSRDNSLFDLRRTGIGYKPSIRANARIMLLTATLGYFVIQIPALLVDDQKVYATHKQCDEAEVELENKAENTWALVGMIVCFLEFVFYVYMTYQGAKVERQAKEADDNMKGVLAPYLPTSHRKTDPSSIVANMGEHGLASYMSELRSRCHLDGITREAAIKQIEQIEFQGNMKQILESLYVKHSQKVGAIDFKAFQAMIRECCIDYTGAANDQRAMFEQCDEDGNGVITREEFFKCIKLLATLTIRRRPSVSQCNTHSDPAGDDDGADDDDSDTEVPEEFQGLSEQEMRRQVFLKSGWMLTLGTLLILLFSDPMVAVLNRLGEMTEIPNAAFYISFILAPIASNASEAVCAYTFASRKTSKTITVSLSTLEGAACMNNTFCLGIFLGLIYFQGLAWKFTAETLVTFFVQLLMFLMVIFKDKHTMYDGFVILALYPLSLVLVFFLENVLKLD